MLSSMTTEVCKSKLELSTEASAETHSGVGWMQVVLHVQALSESRAA